MEPNDAAHAKERFRKAGYEIKDHGDNDVAVFVARELLVAFMKANTIQGKVSPLQPPFDDRPAPMEPC